MAGIGQVLGQRCGVFLVVDRGTGSEPRLHHKNIRVVVQQRDYDRAQHQDGQSNCVRGHVLPVQETDKGALIEDRLVVAEQRGTAQHGGRDPGEGAPALASKRVTRFD